MGFPEYPGIYNIDLSLSRSFRRGWPGEAGRLTFRVVSQFEFVVRASWPARAAIDAIPV